MPLLYSSNTIGRIPLTGKISPFKFSSPASVQSFMLSASITPIAVKIATAIGRSKPVPVFLIFAGDRFTVIRLAGKIMPTLCSAVLTRSFASLTSEVRFPTISKTGIPVEISTSTCTGIALIPSKTAVLTVLYIYTPIPIGVNA